MRKFENKKSFKNPKLIFGKRKVKEEVKRNFDAAEKAIQDWTFPIDEAPMEYGPDEGEIYLHVIETDTWVWMTPEMAYCYGMSLCMLANSIIEEKLGNS